MKIAAKFLRKFSIFFYSWNLIISANTRATVEKTALAIPLMALVSADKDSLAPAVT